MPETEAGQVFCLHLTNFWVMTGLSQSEFSDRIEQHRSYVNRLLHGEDHVSLQKAEEIAASLQIPTADMLDPSFDIVEHYRAKGAEWKESTKLPF